MLAPDLPRGCSLAIPGESQRRQRRRSMGTPYRWSQFRCRRFRRGHAAPFLAACRESARVRLCSRDERQSETPSWTILSRNHPPCRQLFWFRQCRQRQSRFPFDLHFISFICPRGRELLLILGGSCFFAQQAELVLDNERTISKGITINAGKPGQPFGGELCRDNVDQKLPVGWNRRKLKHKVARIFWQVLADHHDGSAHLPQISSHGQVLPTHTLSVDPHAKTHLLGNHFLRAMPEAACAHGGRRRFDAFLPKEPGLLATPQTGTSSQEVIDGSRYKPRGICNL